MNNIINIETWSVTLYLTNGSRFTHTGVVEINKKAFGRIELVTITNQRHRYAHVKSIDSVREPDRVSY